MAYRNTSCPVTNELPAFQDEISEIPTPIFDFLEISLAICHFFPDPNHLLLAFYLFHSFTTQNSTTFGKKLNGSSLFVDKT